MKVSERWLRQYIDVKEPIEKIAQALTMAGLEVKNIQRNDELKDMVFEVEITSNRPDWLSYLGIAREVSALYDVPVNYPDSIPCGDRQERNDFSIMIKEKELCSFYAGVIIEDVENKESPQEIKDKLCAIGMRPVNLIVDLTNIVLFELGQPMHAFDLDLLKGRKIIVRRAQKGETFTAINHETYSLRSDDLLICDGERSVALAGVMGGVESEVSVTTRNVFLESAFFDPVTIRATSRAHHLHSDSSYRFERKVDLGMVRRAQDRFIALLQHYTAVGPVSAVLYDGNDDVSKTSIDFQVNSIYNTIGMEIPAATVKSILEKLGLTVEDKGAGEDAFTVQVPSFRPDLERPIDLLEEITRIYGYDKVPETLPPRTPHNDALEHTIGKVEKRVKDVCVASGYYEVVPFTLINEEKCREFSSIQDKFVRIVNPQNKDLRLLRPSLIPSMLEVLSENINYGNKDLKLFEIGSRYRKEKGHELPVETKICCMMITGATPRTWYDQGSMMSFFDLKGAVENIGEMLGVTLSCDAAKKADYLDGRCAFTIVAENDTCGHMGALSKDLLDKYDIDQNVFSCEIDMALISDKAVLQKNYVEISRFPVVKRDIAIIVGHDVLVQDMQDEITAKASGLIKNITVIDNFTGKHVPQGKKNVAFSMTFSAQDRTLSGDEIQQIYDAIFTALQKKFKAEYRIK